MLCAHSKLYQHVIHRALSASQTFEYSLGAGATSWRRETILSKSGTVILESVCCACALRTVLYAMRAQCVGKLTSPMRRSS